MSYCFCASSNFSLICSPHRQIKKEKRNGENENKGLTPVAHLAYITPFHSPSMEQKDFLSLGGLKDKKERIVIYFIKKGRVFHPISDCKMWFQLYCATIFLLQNLSGDPVLLSTVEGFGVEHDVSTIARLGAGDVALPTQLHPRHSQNRPGQTGSS